MKSDRQPDDAIPNLLKGLNEILRALNAVLRANRGKKLYMGSWTSFKTAYEDTVVLKNQIESSISLLSIKKKEDMFRYYQIVHENLQLFSRTLSQAVHTSHANNRDESEQFFLEIQTQTGQKTKELSDLCNKKMIEMDPFRTKVLKLCAILENMPNSHRGLVSSLYDGISKIASQQASDKDKFFTISFKLAKSYAHLKSKADNDTMLENTLLRLLNEFELQRDSSRYSAAERLISFLTPIIENDIWKQRNNPHGVREMQAILNNHRLSAGEKIAQLIQKAIAIKDKNPHNPTLFSQSGKGRAYETQRLYDAIAVMDFDKLKDLSDALKPSAPALDL